VIFKNGKSGKNDPGLKFNLQFANEHKARDNAKIIDISNGWKVSFDQDMGGPESHQFTELLSWSEFDLDGIRYYSGKSVYTKKINIEKADLEKSEIIVLDFDNIQETARVLVNGNDCGILWNPPYQTDISAYLSEGENDISIELINTWNNRLVGDVRNPDQKQYTNTNIKNKFVNGELLDSGIIGKAFIRFVP
jgi:hypothetical protein